MLSSSWKSLREACAVNNGWKSPGSAPLTSLLTLLFGIYCWGKQTAVLLLRYSLSVEEIGTVSPFNTQPWLWKRFLSSQRDSVGCNLFPLVRYNCILPHLAWGFYLLCSVPYFRLRLSCSLFHRTQSRSITAANVAGRAARRQLVLSKPWGTGARSKTCMCHWRIDCLMKPRDWVFSFSEEVYQW